MCLLFLIYGLCCCGFIAYLCFVFVYVGLREEHSYPSQEGIRQSYGDTDPSPTDVCPGRSECEHAQEGTGRSLTSYRSTFVSDKELAKKQQQQQHQHNKGPGL